MLTLNRHLLSFVLLTLALSLLAVGCGDDDGPVEPGPPPNIQIFTAAPTDLPVGDSSQITYKVADADSVKLYPAGTKLTPADSGQTWVKPLVATTYILKAFNKDGRDSADVLVTVQAPPASIEAINGLYYKGVMGGDSQTPSLQFRALDAGGHPLVTPWMHFEIVTGDGTLSTDSAQVDRSGTATILYDFDGAMGHATIRAYVRDVDTVMVDVRASTIIPGPGGQAQYVLLDTDTYLDVKNFNGEPEGIVYSNGLHYVEYVASLGLVIMVQDTAFPSDVLQDMEPVVGAILTTGFTGARTADSVGLGSTTAEFEAAYGTADTTYLDDQAPPPLQAYFYDPEGLVFFTSVPAGPTATVQEMHVYYRPPGSPALMDSRRARRVSSVLR